jgi:hypothetical protein
MTILDSLVRRRACVCCRGPSQGNFNVHENPDFTGRELRLCNDCGEGVYPSLGVIWERIAKARHTVVAPARKAKGKR